MRSSFAAARQVSGSRIKAAFPFRRAPLSLMLAGAFVLASAPVFAAEEPTVAQLQAEVAHLKQALEQAQRANAAATTPAPATPSSTAPTAATPAGDQAAAPPAAEKPATPQEPQALDEIVVHSRNRIERLQDVPLSVAVVSGAELEATGALSIGSITKRAANVSWNQGNQRTSSLSIRGIGKIGQTEAQDPSVGIIVDGVNYAYNPLSSFNFDDIETVEVTRGPQGTLLGKNTNLGVINITTKRPSFTPSSDYSITYGQRDTLRGTLAAGGPVIDDTLAWRANLAVDKGAGDIRNRYNYDSSYQNIDRFAGRVQFLLTQSADFTARVALEAQPRAGENTNGRTFYKPTPTKYADGTANPLSTDASTRLARRWFLQNGNYSYLANYLNGSGTNSVDNDAQQPVVTGTNGASAELTWNLGSHTLTSITGYKNYHFNAQNNDEGTVFDIQRSSGHFLDYWQASQELRLSSATGGFFDYQTGLYFIQTQNTDVSNVIYGADAGAWYASKTQYAALDADSNGRYLMQNSLDGLWKASVGQNIRNKSAAAFGQANWHFNEALTLTTGLRLTHEERSNPGYSLLAQQGYGAELNPVQVGSAASGYVQLGGFDSTSTGALNPGNTAAQLALADRVANKYFGAAITNTAGAAYNSLTAAQKQQVAYAKAIRAAQIGVLWNYKTPQSFRKDQPAFVLSPTYKINDDLTSYFSIQYGEKAGISQITNGVSNLTKAEKALSYELGLKSAWLDRTLILNADLYLTTIKDYQQAVQVYDAYTTTLKNDGTLYYTSATGNVPKVQATGLEIDGVYNGIRNLTLRFSGAYNKATYKDFKYAAQPAEAGNVSSPYRDVSGRDLPGAPRYTLNLGAQYKFALANSRELHVDWNTTYNTRFNSDTSLSNYAWIPAHSTSDAGIGIRRQDGKFDVSLIVTNLFDDRTPLAQTWNSWTPATERWIGIKLSGKL